MFQNIDRLPKAAQVTVYIDIYQLALSVPVLSVLGVALGAIVQHRQRRQLRRQGFLDEDIAQMLNPQDETPTPNWWILGGSQVFVAFTLFMGLSAVPYNQEIIFAGSWALSFF